ncbi:MAG: ABC transporter ATP-binding protein [Ignisphaera sp.]|nr:ABC transporter ATP-binding protein [Ignisphaera sp.]MDW8085408.1 ABC transporter ATP-binding protein [Ignisphaera sp.]
MYAGYGKINVLFNINMVAERSKITAIIGPNGAGKTTLLNSIFGIADIFKGRILLNGSDITGLKPHKIAKRGVGYVTQTNNIFADLTVEENLRLAAHELNKGDYVEKKNEVLELFPRLKEFLGRRAGTLSGGERRMLAIAIAMMKSPTVVLLDEVTTDLAPIMVKKVLEKVVELKEKLGLTILLVEQYAHRALEIADRVYLLVSGEIKFGGEPRELLKHEDLIGLYLGAV